MDMDNRQRTDEVLRFFIDRFSGEVGRVLLVKLAYLADLEAWRHLGRPLSGLNYKVDRHGPFDKSFYNSIERLTEHGLVSETSVPFPTGVGYRYVSRQTRAYKFTSAEMAVLGYIARAFGGKSLNDVLDVAYSTKPFKRARARGKGAAVPIKQSKFEGAEELGGVRLDRVIAGFEAIEDGEAVDVNEWLHDLQGSPR